MEKKKMLILASLGLISHAEAHNDFEFTPEMDERMQEIFFNVELHPDTFAFIEELINNNILYIRSYKDENGLSRQELVVDSSEISNDLYFQLQNSRYVTENSRIGGFVLNDTFTAVLVSGNALDDEFLNKLNREGLLQKIQKRMKAGFRSQDLIQFANCFYSN